MGQFGKWLVQHRAYLLLVHSHTGGRYDMAEVGHFLDPKCTLCALEEEAMSF
jgi:hypothetical protein